LSKQELDALYLSGSLDNWTEPAEGRRDWAIARQWLESMRPDGASVLDVGCFDGSFLESLGGRFAKHGVEIHSAALERSKSRGVEIVGNDFGALDRLATAFDCITAFDVIEHMERPRGFLQQCAKAVRPGGLILIGTGNLDALTFRLMGSRCAYCHVAEHISFISPRWCQEQARQLDLKVERIATYCHGGTGLALFLSGAARSLFYKALPGAFATLRKRGWGGVDAKLHPELAYTPPGWGGAEDHLMALFEKPRL